MEKAELIKNYLETLDALMESIKCLEVNAQLLRENADSIVEDLKNQGISAVNAREELANAIRSDSASLAKAIQQFEKASAEFQSLVSRNLVSVSNNQDQ